MIESSVYNQEGKETGKMKLNGEIFGKAVKIHLINEAVVSMRSNARRSSAHTKTRGEISGGGKKPWKQKGTGRARHGSIRSPLWRGGGVTFGPRNERNYFKKMSARARKDSLLMALSDKAASGKISVIEEIRIDKSKTKEISKILNALKIKFPALLITGKSDKLIKRVGQNIKNTAVNSSNNLNLLDILKAKNILATKQALEEIEEKYKK